MLLKPQRLPLPETPEVMMDWRELQTRCFAADCDTVTLPKHDVLELLDAWGDAQQKIASLKLALRNISVAASEAVTRNQ